MNGRALFGVDRAALVNRVAGDVQHAAKRLGTNGYGDSAAGVPDFLSADHPFRGVHRQRANGLFTKVLRDL